MGEWVPRTGIGTCCGPVPGEPGDELEDELVLLADAFVTGWHATELAQVTLGATVAVFGAGTIGPLAAHSSLLKGAAEVYSVDAVLKRLDKAGEIGAVPVNYLDGDPVDQIRELRRTGGLVPGGAAISGLQVGLDAVGFQAHDRLAPGVENPTQVIGDLARLINPTGHLGIAGVDAEKDLPPAPEGHADGRLTVPWATFFSKGISVRFGRTDDRRYTVLLRNLVLSGRARPSVVVTYHGELDDAPGLYRSFDQRADGVIKAVLRP
jgi:glutathione-independent formaldehyde dehydrogenase